MFRNGIGVLAFLMARGTTAQDWYRLGLDAETVYEALWDPAGRARIGRVLGRDVEPPDPAALRAEIERADRAGVRLVAECDADYPPALREAPQPPPLLWLRGDASRAAVRGVAIVGTRRATPAGVAFARRLARELSRAGVVVVSGLARGIDTAAHVGSLEGPAGGVGVCGTGLDVPYPTENAGLMVDLARRGCLISEQPMGMHAAPHVFPRRNRLIAALARAVVVVQGGVRSGALITARHALELGRDVGAVPGFPGDARSAGPNRLLRDGAFVVESVADVFEAVPALGAGTTPDDGAAGEGAAHPSGGPVADAVRGDGTGAMAAADRAVLEALDGVPAGPDALAALLGLAVETVQRALVRLEVAGAVARDGTGRFCRTGARSMGRGAPVAPRGGTGRPGAQGAAPGPGPATGDAGTSPDGQARP